MNSIIPSLVSGRPSIQGEYLKIGEKSVARKEEGRGGKRREAEKMEGGRRKKEEKEREGEEGG
jgi:hypothetical protein